ncbi:MAG: chemotaxis-specific protein-glutamate methyltransferase CheB, partial [Longimicrobiales bacterium]
SATTRQLLRAIIESDPALQVVGEAQDGAEAVELVVSLTPDVVIMDVHMPVRDGLEATKEIMMRAPTPIIIVSTAKHYRDIEISLSATQAGAVLMLAKPAGPGSPHYADDAAELIAMTKALAQVKVVRRWTHTHEPSIISTREPTPGSFNIVAMAASTGGPAALRRILLDLPASFAVPVVIVQHMAHGFMAGFAQWLGANSAMPVRMCKHGQKLEPGRVYVAPDDKHLGFSNDRTIVLSDAPPINRFRPSADYLFSSVAKTYGARCTAVICSGMGVDGAHGLEQAHKAGTFVIAQDEASSVVYGMAQEAVKRNAVDVILPIGKIGSKLNELIRASAHA